MSELPAWSVPCPHCGFVSEHAFLLRKLTCGDCGKSFAPKVAQTADSKTTYSFVGHPDHAAYRRNREAYARELERQAHAKHAEARAVWNEIETLDKSLKETP